MILLGIGSNLAHPPANLPRATAEAAVAALAEIEVQVLVRSGWYLSEPVPASDQPWFVNGVVLVASVLRPQMLLDRLLGLETRFGRTRSASLMRVRPAAKLPRCASIKPSICSASNCFLSACSTIL